LEFWADIPYAIQIPVGMDGMMGSSPTRPEIIGDAAWKAKTAAAECYRAHHSMLWSGTTDIPKALETEARHLGESVGLSERCELYWQR
jgi:hypothetical protein